MQMTQTQFASLSQEMQAQLTAQGIQIVPDGQTMQVAPQPTGLMWGAPVPAVNVSGWSTVTIPIKVDTDSGECNVGLNFEGVTTPEQVSALVKMLISRGFPVKTWKPKNEKKSW